MLLTKKTLNKILQDWRVSTPSELGNELLHEYGNFAIDDEGHVFEYTEQDIYEQLRRKLRPYENHQQRGAWSAKSSCPSRQVMWVGYGQRV